MGGVWKAESFCLVEVGGRHWMKIAVDRLLTSKLVNLVIHFNIIVFSLV